MQVRDDGNELVVPIHLRRPVLDTGQGFFLAMTELKKALARI